MPRKVNDNNSPRYRNSSFTNGSEAVAASLSGEDAFWRWGAVGGGAPLRAGNGKLVADLSELRCLQSSVCEIVGISTGVSHLCVSIFVPQCLCSMFCLGLLNVLLFIQTSVSLNVSDRSSGQYRLRGGHLINEPSLSTSGPSHVHTVCTHVVAFKCV